MKLYTFFVAVVLNIRPFWSPCYKGPYFYISHGSGPLCWPVLNNILLNRNREKSLLEFWPLTNKHKTLQWQYNDHIITTPCFLILLFTLGLLLLLLTGSLRIIKKLSKEKSDGSFEKGWDTIRAFNIVIISSVRVTVDNSTVKKSFQ